MTIAVSGLIVIPCCAWSAEEGPVLHLSFDDQDAIGRDSSSHDNHATAHGDPTWVESGVSGGALRLDGLDDYLDCGNPEGLQLGTGDFTLEAWLKTDSRDAYMLIVSTGRYGAGYGLFSLSIREENVLNADYRCRDENGTIAWRRRQAPPTLPPIITRQPINNGRWHHVAVVADRDHNGGIPRLYRDGVEVTEGSAIAGGALPATSITVANSDPLFIGAQSPDPQRFYAGLIDDVRLYRRALNGDEIMAQYQASEPEQQPPPPLPEAEIELPEVTPLQWEMDEFVIMPWGGPSLQPDVEGNDALPQVIKDANFNVVLCHLDKLELCREWGFKALLQGVSPQEAATLRDDEAVWGYMIKDEPKNHTEYPALAWRMQELREADPNHPGYINLGGSLNGHHPLYLQMVKPDLLSYDYYQWSWGQERHFSRLEEYRRGALEHDMPLMVWVHGNAGPPEMREDEYYYHAPDNQQRMRHSVFTSLAYGAKGIQWFHGKHLFAGDHLRPCGQDVAAINAELQNLGPKLVELESVRVYHTPPLPADTQPIPDGYWVQLSEGEFVLGMMRHPDQPDTEYLMLANRDHTSDATALLDIARQGVDVERLNKDTGQWDRQEVAEADGASRVAVPMAAGDGELLRVR
ncbi:MAG: LamG domain-containing protein [Armatimonadota bacterium]